MADAKETCRTIIAAALNDFIKEKDPQAETVAPESIVVQNAPNPEMGDLGAPMFAFAKACFKYAIDTKQDLWFSTKDTIAKIYDGEFKRVFEEEFENNYRAEFEKLGLTYFYTLIDDAVARVIRSEGGFILSCIVEKPFNIRLL